MNLTGLVGLGGVNCFPQVSSDGTRILFTHFNYVEGYLPCQSPESSIPAGTYIVNMDGTGPASTSTSQPLTL